MLDSSAKGAAALARVSPQNAFRLLSLIRDSTLRRRSFIATRFSESATHFDETLAFAESLGWVRIHDDQLSLDDALCDGILDSRGTARTLLTVEAVLERSGATGSKLAKYLTQFEATDGVLAHSPSFDQRLADAEVRDFLMELGAVVHDEVNGRFVLADALTHLALLARAKLGPRLTDVARSEEERASFGRRAELAALQWERERLGPAHDRRVIHVAASHPFACFDIQSVSLDDNGMRPRIIEVKAVSATSFEFHWSAPEIEAARLLGNQYFLYLLPSAGDDSFDVSRLHIVPNAYTNVLRHDSSWSTSPSDLICRKRGNVGP